MDEIFHNKKDLNNNELGCRGLLSFLLDWVGINVQSEPIDIHAS